MKLHKIFIAHIVLFFLIPCYGQNGYNKTFDLGRSVWFMDVEHDGSSGCLISGLYYNDSSEFQNILLVYSDTTGELLKTMEVSDPLSESSLSIVDESTFIINKNSIAVMPFVFSSRGSLGLLFADPKSEFVTVIEYEIDSGATIIPYDIIEYKNGYLISGAYQNPPFLSINAFLMSIDSNGNKNWLYEYGDENSEEYGRSITCIDTNFYLLSGAKWENGEDSSVGWTAAIDSLGKLKWEWSSDTNEVPSGPIMSLDFDKEKSQIKYFTFLDRPTTYPGKNYKVSKPVLVTRDTSMQLLSYSEYGDYVSGSVIRDLLPINEGWIGVGGTTTSTDEYYTPEVIDLGQVLKLAHTEELLWEVKDSAFHHPILGSRSYLKGAAESSSGSIYAVGWANNYDENELYRGYGWILKITSDGCVDTVCTTTSIEERIRDRDQNVILYPNPVKKELNIRIKQLYNDAYIKLFNLNGKVLLREEVVEGVNSFNIDFPSGMYICNIVSENRIIYSGEVVVNGN